LHCFAGLYTKHHFVRVGLVLQNIVTVIGHQRRQIKFSTNFQQFGPHAVFNIQAVVHQLEEVIFLAVNVLPHGGGFQRLIKLDKHLSRYELAAYICWRASRCPAGHASNYREQRDAITYLYDYLISDNPDDDEAQENYQRLLQNSLPIDAPPHTLLDTADHKTGLQLCRHLETLRQLDHTYRKALLDAINTYYQRLEKLTLPQAYLRYAIQQALT